MSPTPPERWMARALRLARHGLYTTAPNPRVGCVLVKEGRVIGEGWHERAGEPMPRFMPCVMPVKRRVEPRPMFPSSHALTRGEPVLARRHWSRLGWPRWSWPCAIPIPWWQDVASSACVERGSRSRRACSRMRRASSIPASLRAWPGGALRAHEDGDESRRTHGDAFRRVSVDHWPVRQA